VSKENKVKKENQEEKKWKNNPPSSSRLRKDRKKGKKKAHALKGNENVGSSQGARQNVGKSQGKRNCKKPLCYQGRGEKRCGWGFGCP